MTYSTSQRGRPLIFTAQHPGRDRDDRHGRRSSAADPDGKAVAVGETKVTVNAKTRVTCRRSKRSTYGNQAPEPEPPVIDDVIENEITPTADDSMDIELPAVHSDVANEAIVTVSPEARSHGVAIICRWAAATDIACSKRVGGNRSSRGISTSMFSIRA